MLRQYQKEGIEKILNYFNTNNSISVKPGFLLADETGLGKSVQALTVLHKLCIYVSSSLEKNQTSLIICPSSLKEKWKLEIKKWLPKKRSYSIIIVSYTEIIKPEIFNYIREQNYLLCILDESHYLKDFKSKRTQAVFGSPRTRHKTIISACTYTLALTATPIPNRIGELYPWFWAMKNRIIEKYTYEGFILNWAGWYKFTPYGLQHKGVRNEVELKKALGDSFLKRKKYDVLDELPESVRDEIFIECKSSTYKEEKKLLENLLEKAGHVGKNADFLLDNPILLQQILETVPSFDQLTEFKLKAGLMKIKPVLQYLFESVLPETKKFILFCYHSEVAKTYKELLEKKKIKTELITGAVNPDARLEIIDRVNEFTECVLIATMKSVKEGFDLIGFNRSYFTEIDWAPYVMTQAEGRTLRIGQKNSVLWCYFLYDKGIEKYIYNLVNEKNKTIQAVLGE